MVVVHHASKMAVWKLIRLFVIEPGLAMGDCPAWLLVMWETAKWRPVVKDRIVR